VFEIGNSLRSARERQDLGYPEIELATKIRAKYVRALEEEDFDALPGDTYVRGFLRTYADFLGLDGEIYVDEYATRYLTTWNEEELAPVRARPRRTRRERTIERRAVVLALAGIAVVTALVLGAWLYGGPSARGPLLQHHQAKTKGLVVHGVRHGTYLVVRRDSRTGRLLFSGTLAPGRTERFSGTRFYVFARTPSGVGMTRSPGVTILGK
jgi:helix-turn-helix protein